MHSDTWLLAVAFYNGARLNREGRERLFELINEQPTCYEIVSGKASRDAAKPREAGRPRAALQATKHGSTRQDSPDGEASSSHHAPPYPQFSTSRPSCLFFEMYWVLGVCDHVAVSSGRLSSLPKAYLPG